MYLVPVNAVCVAQECVLILFVYAARAMGSLVVGVGEEPLEGLLPWLIETMQSDASSVERSGGAQVRVCACVCACGRCHLLPVVSYRLCHPRVPPKCSTRWVKTS